MTFARVVACVCSTRLRLFQTTMRTCFFCRGVADVMGLGALQSSRAGGKAVACAPCGLTAGCRSPGAVDPENQGVEVT